ncbi:MAG: hypothetical protein ACLS69_01995 [Butyricicoccus sp.]
MTSHPDHEGADCDYHPQQADERGDGSGCTYKNRTVWMTLDGTVSTCSRTR